MQLLQASPAIWTSRFLFLVHILSLVQLVLLQCLSLVQYHPELPQEPASDATWQSLRLVSLQSNLDQQVQRLKDFSRVSVLLPYFPVLFLLHGIIQVQRRKADMEKSLTSGECLSYTIFIGFRKTLVEIGNKDREIGFGTFEGPALKHCHKLASYLVSLSFLRT